MKKIFVFILTLGFIFQTSGAVFFVQKTVPKTEQCPDDNEPTEETGNEAFKKDIEQISTYFNYIHLSEKLVYAESGYECFYPSGFYCMPYLPPR